MTTRELIEKLKGYPSDMLVVRSWNCAGFKSVDVSELPVKRLHSSYGDDGLVRCFPDHANTKVLEIK